MIVRTLASSWALAAIAALSQGGSCQKEQAGGGEATKDAPGPQVTLEGIDTSALSIDECELNAAPQGGAPKLHESKETIL